MQTYVRYGKQASETQPEHLVSMELAYQRVRAIFNGVAVADSCRVMVQHESRHVPVYYFPREDVRFDLMEPTKHSTF